MTIEERLEVLERELAEMKARKVIRANAVIVEDEKGMIRACLSVNEYGPFLSLYDEKDKPRAMLAASNKWLGPTLTLNDENGNPRVQLAVCQPQAVLFNVKGERLPVSVLKNASWLRLTDEKGKPLVELAATLNGPELRLYDENSKIRAELSACMDGPRLFLHDKNGIPIWSAP